MKQKMSNIDYYQFFKISKVVSYRMVHITPKVLWTRKVGSRDADASKNSGKSYNFHCTELINKVCRREDPVSNSNILVPWWSGMKY